MDLNNGLPPVLKTGYSGRFKKFFRNTKIKQKITEKTLILNDIFRLKLMTREKLKSILNQILLKIMNILKGASWYI